jgi:hypothetical protein
MHMSRGADLFDPKIAYVFRTENKNEKRMGGVST